MSKIRTFLAVEITPDLRDRCITLIGSLAGTQAKVKWVDEENLHWTLKFLGDVDDQEIPAVCDAVASGAASVECFDIAACGVGAFPNTQRPRTVWLGVTTGETQFVTLHDAIEQPIGKLGFRREQRRFRPHLTLGRVRGLQGIDDLAGLLADQAEFDAGSMRVESVAVFSSQLERQGPRYQVLGRAELAKP